MSTDGLLHESKTVCPHCWHRFYPDEALFISKHPELFGDPVAGETENRRFAPHEISKGSGGEPLDPKGWKMTERACPQCHLQVPLPVLTRRPYFISVVGAPRSGKTYFLTSMVHGLRKDLVRFLGLTLNDSDSHEVKAFLEYEKELFFPSDPNSLTFLHKTQETGSLYNKVILDGVEVQLPKPFIFTLRPMESHPLAAKLKVAAQRNLVLYDNAGESFEFLKEKAGHIRVTQHLSECDAVLFNFDPLQCPDARTRLASVSHDPQVSQMSATYRQETILSEVVNRIKRHRALSDGEFAPSVLAVCVQKYDVWKSLVPHGTTINDDGGGKSVVDHSSIEYDQRRGIGGLDIEEINTISLLIRSFIQDLCPEFVALAEASFRTVRYFPVSALGTSPELEDGQTTVDAGANLLKVRPANLQPFRVTHPMLWLLHKWGLILRTTRSKDRASSLPQGEIQKATPYQLTVLSPVSRRVLILDFEYAESVIIDPYVGKPVWIPKAQGIGCATGPNEAQPAKPASPAPTPPARKALSLDPPPPPPPRRGWFRK
jgi:hypothetical protein